MSRPDRPVPPPLEGDDRLITGVITAGFVIALVVLLIVRGRLPAADRWWALWTTQYRLSRDPDGRLAAGFSGLRMLSLEEVTPGTGPEAGH